MAKNILVAFCCVLMVFCLKAQQVDVYPVNWWTGMKNPDLQLLIHSDTDIDAQRVWTNNRAVKVRRVTTLENKHYLAVDLTIHSSAKPGTFNLYINGKGRTDTLVYNLLARDPGNGKTRIRGVTAKDFIYLIMPDRFANGDPTNDRFSWMRDKVADRNNEFARHGGDLKGIEEHLDYFESLGVTALWLTPVIENDMPLTDEGGSKRSTYHGYAFTDHYKVDPRLGGNEAYLRLIKSMQKRGLKIIQDAVYNHVGEAHWFARDIPSHEWFNRWPVYTQTSYKDQPLMDPYASEYDRRRSVQGWFTKFMPDLNQKNPFVANFLIQHAVWSTEYFGIDGWRVDTYFYSDPDFLNQLNRALLDEFPALTVFGEAWVYTVPNSAFFCENNMDVSFRHNLQGVTDFALNSAFIDGVNQSTGWTEGLNRIYGTLAQDFLYKNPMRNEIFLDNHDLNRIYSVVGEDTAKLKVVLTWLLTQRGIPQLYYGTEVLMKNFKDPTDAKVREDFPGGWKEDEVNCFAASGRSAKQNAIFDFISKLAHFRKSSPALGEGKLMQFLPENNSFVYFRYTTDQTILIATNTGSEPITLDMSRFSERISGYRRMRNVINREELALDSLTLGPMDARVYELLK